MKATKLNPRPLPLSGHHLRPPCNRPHNISFSLRPYSAAPPWPHSSSSVPPTPTVCSFFQGAKAAKSAGVPVNLDAGGRGEIPSELPEVVDIFSPNETELGRMVNMPTESFEQIRNAVSKCHKMDVKQVLVKLGGKGSAFFVEGEEPIEQPICLAPGVFDTTGAGDTFTAAFAVALVEGKSKQEYLKFAAAVASLCVRVN